MGSNSHAASIKRTQSRQNERYGGGMGIDNTNSSNVSTSRTPLANGGQSLNKTFSKFHTCYSNMFEYSQGKKRSKCECTFTIPNTFN